MKWQDELSHLVASGWEPVFDGGRFAVRSRNASVAVTLTPPQGIYDVWFARLTGLADEQAEICFSGHSAFGLLERLRPALEKDTGP